MGILHDNLATACGMIYLEELELEIHLFHKYSLQRWLEVRIGIGHVQIMSV